MAPSPPDKNFMFSSAQAAISAVLDSNTAAIADLFISVTTANMVSGEQSEVTRLTELAKELKGRLDNFDAYAVPLIEQEGFKKRDKVENRKAALRTETEAALKNANRRLERLQPAQVPQDANAISFGSVLAGLIQLAEGNSEIGLRFLNQAFAGQENLDPETRLAVNLLVYFGAHQFGYEQADILPAASAAVLTALQEGQYPDEIISLFTRVEGKSSSLVSSDTDLLIHSGLISDALLFAMAAGTDPQQVKIAKANILQKNNNDPISAAEQAMTNGHPDLATKFLYLYPDLPEISQEAINHGYPALAIRLLRQKVSDPTATAQEEIVASNTDLEIDNRAELNVYRRITSNKVHVLMGVVQVAEGVTVLGPDGQQIWPPTHAAAVIAVQAVAATIKLDACNLAVLQEVINKLLLPRGRAN